MIKPGVSSFPGILGQNASPPAQFARQHRRTDFGSEAPPLPPTEQFAGLVDPSGSRT